MNNSVRISIFISASAALFSCGSPRTVMRSWVGNTENELYQRWGKPVKIIDNGHDGRIAVYMPDANSSAARKDAYCDFKFKTSCIPPTIKQYKMAKLFYITPLGNIYAYKIETREKAISTILH